MLRWVQFLETDVQAGRRGRKTDRWQGEFRSSVDLNEQKRRMLLREAGRAFSESGFHNTSLDEIALRLGVSKTVFYHYFRNKNEILLSCFEVGFEVAEQALIHAGGLPANGLERVVGFVRVYVQSICSELGACAVSLELNSLAAADLPPIRRRRKQFDLAVRALVQAGIDDGSIASTDPTVVVAWIMSAATALPRWFRAGERLGIEDVATEYAALTRRMLAAQP